jgi:hypothetical protein
MLLGDIGTAYGLPIWVALVASALILYAFLRLRGVRVDEEAASEAGAVVRAQS